MAERFYCVLESAEQIVGVVFELFFIPFIKILNVSHFIDPFDRGEGYRRNFPTGRFTSRPAWGYSRRRTRKYRAGLLV